MHMGRMLLSMVMAVVLEVEVNVWEFRDHRVNDVHIKTPSNIH